MPDPYTAPADRLAAVEHPVLEAIAARWSPRVLDPAAEVDDATLASMLEAARWASSWGGSQPARFVVGRRDDRTFDGLVACLSRGNSGWAPAAAALILGVTRVRDDVTTLTHGAFDLGQATAHLLLQAVACGVVAHPMAGFDAAAARSRFSVPDEYEPLVLVAVGRLGDPADVDEGLRAKESRPRRRLPLAETAFAGTWGHPAL